MTSPRNSCILILVTSPGGPQSLKSVCFPSGHGSLNAKRPPRSQSWGSSPGCPQSPSLACSPASFCSPSARPPPESSRSLSPALCPRGTCTLSSLVVSLKSPPSPALFQRAHSPVRSQAPAPGFPSALAWEPGSRDQELALTVEGRGWASNPATHPGGGLCPRSAAWDPLQPSPRCPLASGMSRASGKPQPQTQVGHGNPGRELGKRLPGRACLPPALIPPQL